MLSFVAIVAGYEKEMDKFINSNPGLKSRFNTHLNFENFSSQELMKIFSAIASSSDYKILAATEKKLQEVFNDETKKPKQHFSNARYVRNLFEKVLRNQAMRLGNIKTELTREDLMELFPEDIIG